MRKSEIESWTLQIIERVNNHLPNEDSHVELKSDWTEVKTTARQLAGHANAARGEPILWLIGVDEKKGVIGVGAQELANWISSIKSEFDGVAPQLVMDLNIPIDELVIVALYFETDRAPYVVKNPNHGQPSGGNIAWEVPWREGRSTRSARRQDLLRILVPISTLPDAEVLNGQLIQAENRDGEWNWSLQIHLYLTPFSGLSFAIPFHRCKGWFQVIERTDKIKLENLRLTPPYSNYAFTSSGSSFPDSLTINNTNTELIVQGPGMVNIRGSSQMNVPGFSLPKTVAVVDLELLTTLSDLPVRISSSLNFSNYEENPKSCTWSLV
jgi:hypothetical protein